MKKQEKLLRQIQSALVRRVGEVLEQYNETVKLVRLARIFNLSQAYLSQIKTGHRCNASLSTVLEIAEKLGIKYDIKISNLDGDSLYTIEIDTQHVADHIKKFTGEQL